MRLKKLTMPAALLIMLCAACNSGSYKEARSSATADSTATMMDNDNQQTPQAKPDAAANTGSPQQAKQGSAEMPDHEDWDRKIIKTADLGIEVKSFRLFSYRLRAAVKQSGAYIAQEQLSQSPSEIENTVTVKVPVDRFEDLMTQLPSDSDKLIDEKVSSQDVTMELVDTKSRLETKKEVRERYLDLLKQAHSMKDIIAVQNEINDIQQEMDQASGRIAYLGHSSAYSTINLHYFQFLDGAPADTPSPNFITKLKDAIADGWGGLSGLLLQLISVWPLWIALGVAILWIRKWLRASRLKAESVRPAEQISGGTPPAA